MKTDRRRSATLVPALVVFAACLAVSAGCIPEVDPAKVTTDDTGEPDWTRFRPRQRVTGRYYTKLQWKSSASPVS
jgi:hypothetical protein